MKAFIPFDLMLERVARNGSESDVTRFWELTYAGELITRLTTATIVGCVDDSRDRDRYGLEHLLVRADGLGDWVQAMEQVLTGPPASHLNSGALELRNALTARADQNSWTASAVNDLVEVLRQAYDPKISIKEKPSLRLWFRLFVQLRNKSRGHGAPTPARLSSCVEDLERSINCMAENSPIRNIGWAYLHRNLSGKYRVIPLSSENSQFSQLKTKKAQELPNLQSGVYVWLNQARRLNLVFSNQDCSDFFFPNGDFKANDFEIHSLLTDDRLRINNRDYLLPPSAFPESETEGGSELDTIGNVFTNIPPKIKIYVSRKNLEREVESVIENDRHPIVTLVGRGGIGKTSLTLKVLYDISHKSRYDLIVWFSARDIDLVPTGAKQVRPSILTEREIAKVFRELIGHSEKEKDGKKIDSIEYMSSQLRKCDFGPTLFVFDNFETLRNPHDVYNWIDTNIRLPNKALITSRFRDFKGDYPIDIPGMERDESFQLIEETARELSIENKLSQREKEIIIEEADGHPYIIKILLGEIADKGTFSRPSKLIARRDDVLNALFERTFGTLSPLAARIFMTLASWRSSVPQIVMEATLLRNSYEGIDPESAIDQLVRTSLVERTKDAEGIDNLTVPLSASIFGRAKLQVAANRALMLDDVRFLQSLGASDIKTDNRGLLPRMERLFSDIALKIEHGNTALSEVRPVLEFLARGYAKTWLLISRLEADSGEEDWEERAAEYLRRYLQVEPNGADAQAAWQELELLYRKQDDAIAGCGAFIRAAEYSDPPLARISSMANWLNSNYKAKQSLSVDERAAVFLPLASLMEQHITEASATDLSRLGWLYLNTGDVRRAKEVTELGIERDPMNLHCEKLLERLESQK